MSVKKSTWEILNTDVKDLYKDYKDIVYDKINSRAVKSAVVALVLSGLSFFVPNNAQAQSVNVENLTLTNPKSTEVIKIDSTKSQLSLLEKLRKVRDDRKTVENKVTNRSHLQYGQALAKVIPDVVSPIGQNNFDPSKKSSTQITAHTNPVQTTVDYTHTELKEFFAGTNQDKMQIVTKATGTIQNVTPLGNATVTKGVINTQTTQDYLTVGMFIPGGPDLPTPTTQKIGNTSIQSTTIVATAVQRNKNIPVSVNDEVFSSSTFPNPSDALSTPPINGGNVVRLFPSNIDPKADISVGAPVSDNFAGGTIYNQAGIFKVDSLPQVTQDYLSGNLSSARQTSQYFKNAYAFNLGEQKTQSINQVSTKTITPYLVKQGNFGSIAVVDFDKKDGSAVARTSFRQFSPVSIVIDPINQSVDVPSTIKNSVIGALGALPLNQTLDNAVKKQESHPRPAQNPNDLTLRFENKNTGVNSGRTLSNIEIGAKLLNNLRLNTVSARDTNVKASPNGYVGFSLELGGKNSSYQFSETNYGPKKDGEKTIASLTPPTIDPMSEVDTIFSYTDNISGQTVYKRASMPVGITGGFGDITTTQTSTQPYTTTTATNIINTDIAGQVAGVIGNKNGSVAVASGFSVNPFPGQLAGGVKHNTPVVTAWLRANAQYNVSKNLQVITGANFTTDARPDSPNVAQASLLYRSDNNKLAISMGAAYLGGGSSTSTSIIPVAGARLEFGKTTLLGSLSGNVWSVNPSYQISPNVSIGGYLSNLNKFSTINNPNTQAVGGMHYELQAEVKINRNFNATVGMGNDGVEGSIRYQHQF
jgi:hypothetical protein